MYLLVSILKQTQPLSDIVAGFAKIGITGHSRNGKQSLMAAAFDIEVAPAGVVSE